jgi:hypothetical protein
MDVPSNETIITALALLFALSEALASIPIVRANSVFQLIHGIIMFVAGKNKQ